MIYVGIYIELFIKIMTNKRDFTSVGQYNAILAL